MIINNKLYSLRNMYGIQKCDKKFLKIKLIILNNYRLNFRKMFFRCTNLLEFNSLSEAPSTENNFFKEKIKDMIELTRYVKKDSNKCNIYISEMSNLFDGCSSLKSIKGISDWNISNVYDINDIFANCSSLSSLPDISKWSTYNVENMESMFFKCSSLISLPDISKWDTRKVKSLKGMFCGCKSLSSFPDISKWNICNVNDMSDMSDIFRECNSLTSLPDMSVWRVFKESNKLRKNDFYLQ